MVTDSPSFAIHERSALAGRTPCIVLFTVHKETFRPRIQAQDQNNVAILDLQGRFLGQYNWIEKTIIILFKVESCKI
jgi:hypothetical protein